MIPFDADPQLHGRRPGVRRGPDLLDQPVRRLPRHRPRRSCRTSRPGEQVSGASTICQQLVRMPPLRRRTCWRTRSAGGAEDQGVRSWPCGSASATRARRASSSILEMYMNQVYYGNNAYGIRAAAQAYFGKDITSDDAEDQLTIGEAAMLVGLVRSPSRLDPTQGGGRAERRSRTAASWWWPRPPAPSGCRASCSTTWSSREYITQAQRDEAAAEEIVLAPPAPDATRRRTSCMRCARRGQTAGRREPARPRRPDASTPPCNTTATSAPPRNGRGWRTTWIGSATSSWRRSTARPRWAGSSSCRAGTSTTTRW